MKYLENFKSKTFWNNVLKLMTVFFLLFVLISLAISHFSELVSGNFDVIYQDEMAQGKWKEYFGIKLAISFVYSVYMVSRKGRNVRRESDAS